MKRNLIVGALFVLAIPMGAIASEEECLEGCGEKTDAVVVLPEVRVEASREMPASSPCDSGVVRKVEGINNQLKPIKEVVGYVQSPQSLALKLVNDHVVKIPAWVGYAMDPVGAIKHKAVDEVKNRAKKSAGFDQGCTATPPADTKKIVEEAESLVNT